MNQNPPLTAEEAKNLTFPCLLEVWDSDRVYGSPVIVLVNGFKENRYLDSYGVRWSNAALPPSEIADIMRKQFGSPSEFPKRMLVWDYDESKAKERIILVDLGEKAEYRYIVVSINDEYSFENGGPFNCYYYKNAKPLPKPDPITQEIAKLRQMLANLEAKYNKQSK